MGERKSVEARMSVEAPARAKMVYLIRRKATASREELVTNGDRRVLVAADIEEMAERWLIESGRGLEADVLVVPHYGSKSSSAVEFIAAVD